MKFDYSKYWEGEFDKREKIGIMKSYMATSENFINLRKITKLSILEEGMDILCII